MTLSAPAPLLPLLCCLFAVTAPARADLATSYTPILTEQAELLASDGASLDGFGASAAISGDIAVIGSPEDDNERGSAYIFLRNGSSWSEQAKLVGTERSFLDEFGKSVAISGDTIVIGAPREAGVGSVYVLVRNGPSWSLQAKLTPLDAPPSGYFGNSVAIEGDTVIVGAPWSAELGEAYIFVRSGSSWSEQARLMAPDRERGDGFGLSVAISGDSVAVGAFSHQDGRGAAYIFARSGSSWSEQAQLHAPDESRAVFGNSVAISGDTVAVGAVGTNKVFVFRRTGLSWPQEAQLDPSDGASGFGASVALSGDTLAVGAVWNAAYVFVRGVAGWYERAKLLPSDLWGGYSAFGDAIALSGATVIVGAEGAEAHRGGAAYVFSLSFSPGVTVSPGEGLMTTEWGGTAQFFVVLNTPPAGDVVIDLASSDPGEGAVSPAQLRFTPQDWNIPQTVTLTGVNDFVQDANQPYSVVVSMNTALTTDPAYAGIDPPDPSAVNLGLEGDFYTITPCRVLDTRLPEQGPGLASGAKRLVQIHDTCGIPPTAGAVAINVTVVEPTGSGTLNLCPGDLTPSSLSVLTFKAGKTLSGNAIVLLATDNTGTVAVWPSLGGGGSSHLVIDVSGYFE